MYLSEVGELRKQTIKKFKVIFNLLRLRVHIHEHYISASQKHSTSFSITLTYSPHLGTLLTSTFDDITALYPFQ